MNKLNNLKTHQPQLEPSLEINNLTVISNNNSHNNYSNKNLKTKLSSETIVDKIILENLNLTIYPGETHVIMGPNGAGKSTLANILVKHPDYSIVNGYIKYLGKDLTNLNPETCAQQGMFLSFQNPIAIPGVSNMQFLKTSLNAIRKARGMHSLDAIDFLTLVKQKIKTLQIAEEFLYRSINDDFSGGEKKRNEILQMMLLEPKLAILDEIDSGLDIDALQMIARAIKSTQTKDTAILLITHYQRILKYIKPNVVHILTGKKISMSGNKQLVKKLEAQGYSWLTAEDRK